MSYIVDPDQAGESERRDQNGHLKPEYNIEVNPAASRKLADIILNDKAEEK